MLTENNRTKCIEQYKGLIKSFADPCNEVIYHYTSAEGLRGIIENNEIWLTNVAFVNDTTECRALQEENNLFVECEFTNKYVKNYWKRFTQDSPINKDTYIASFSSGEESLEQWRAYGNFRIGFDGSRLLKHPFNLYQCVYHKNEIKKWILEKEKLVEWGGDCLTDQYKRGAALHLIYAASRKYKNRHFELEKEVRLIVESHHAWLYRNSFSMYADDPPIHYRNHAMLNITVPYVKFITEDHSQNAERHERVKETERQMKDRKLREERNAKKELLPITEVLIGPMTHKKEAKIACEILLLDKGYLTVPVNVSSIPYRGVV